VQSYVDGEGFHPSILLSQFSSLRIQFFPDSPGFSGRIPRSCVVVKYMGDTFLDLSCEKRWRLGGAVDTGRAIKGCQTPLLGLMAVCVKGGTGEAEKTGDQSHTQDMRSDQSQDVNFEVIQSGLNLYWQ